MIEPICWIRQDGVISFHKQKEIDSQYFKWHPLYLHPMRELSDEEIWQIHDATNTNNWVIDFARAIIKASRGEE